MHVGLRVKDLLQRPHFEGIELLAGKDGLHRPIKWAHIVEIETFGHLLNGQEVILTTGMGWADDEEKSIHYVQQLLDYEASALCIELGTHTNTLPQTVLRLADQHDLPIIAFQEEVKFIDITKDLHKIILEEQQHHWWSLERVTEQFNQTLLSNGSISEFLKILYQHTNKPVALAYDEHFRFFPSPSKRKQQQWIKHIRHQATDKHYCTYPILFLDQEIARLYLLTKKDHVSTIDDLAAKRCSETLNQFFWKYHQEKEVQQMKQNEWLLEALNKNSFTEDQIQNKILQTNASIRLNEALIAIIPYKDHPMFSERDKNMLTGTLMTIHSVLTEHGFHIITVKNTEQHHYVVLLINQREKDSLFERLETSLERLHEINQTISKDLQWISFGKITTTYTDLTTSYKTAQTTLHYQQTIGQLSKPFYNQLGVYRLIDHMNDSNELTEIVDDYIGPLITYDNENGTELLRTFQVYLKNLGAKNETARELFIVRQTLYHRLRRIKQLIGDDYMQPKTRLMIEIAIYADAYLYQLKNGLKSKPHLRK